MPGKKIHVKIPKIHIQRPPLKLLRRVTFTLGKRRKQLFPFALGALAILLPVTYLVLRNPREAKAVSWSVNHNLFKQRKQIALVNNTGQQLESGTTYKISIDTKYLYTSGLLLSTCDDLRVLYQPSDSQVTELKRNIEYSPGTICSTSSSSQVVFQLQANIASNSSDSNYYIYYDNEQASTYLK